MRSGVALILAICVLVPIAARSDDGGEKGEGEAKKDLAALQGSWEIVEKELMGKKATREEVDKLKGPMVVKGNSVTQWADDAGIKMIVSEAIWSLNPGAKPKALDITYTDSVNKGQKVRAIYEVDGDRLKVCYALVSEERPTEFAGKPDGNAYLVIYKRVKK